MRDSELELGCGGEAFCFGGMVGDWLGTGVMEVGGVAHVVLEGGVDLGVDLGVSLQT